jgi:vancomycin permeability regulator SanA
MVACGCADARDVFLPYHPRPAEITALLSRGAPLPRYDAALVLGCPADPDGTASLCERCRVKSAVRAFRKGKVGFVVFSGAAAHSPHVEANVMGDLAEHRGVPKDRVLREPRALTTWQNVRFGGRLISARGAWTVLFISTADHLPRVRRIAHFYGIDDDRAGYLACDRDLPMDSDAEFAPPAPPAPTIDD